MSDSVETVETSKSALAENIDRKGRNAYYYAHSHKADGPVWDQKEEPRLLRSESITADKGAAPAVVAAPITNYAWSDEDMKVKVYVDLPTIGELPKENITLDWSPSSFTLTVMDFNGGNLKLTYGKLFADVESVAFKQKPNKIIVIINKAEERPWPCMNAGTPSK